jgi:hypothetical protein
VVSVIRRVLVWLGWRLSTGGTWAHLPPLLDARPRSLREQRDAIRAHRFNRPMPGGGQASTGRQLLEHAYDAGMWAGFALKALFMVCEWCVERLVRTVVLVVVVAALIRLF